MKKENTGLLCEKGVTKWETVQVHDSNQLSPGGNGSSDGFRFPGQVYPFTFIAFSLCKENNTWCKILPGQIKCLKEIKLTILQAQSLWQKSLKQVSCFLQFKYLEIQKYLHKNEGHKVCCVALICCIFLILR